MAAVNNVNSVRLMQPDEIVRRLTRMRGAHGVRRDLEITIGDIARYANVTAWTIRGHQSGRDPISDVWQLIYSRVFAQIDSGELRLQQLVDPKDRRRQRKMLVRVDRPAALPKREIRPLIDLSTMRLKFE